MGESEEGPRRRWRPAAAVAAVSAVLSGAFGIAANVAWDDFPRITLDNFGDIVAAFSVVAIVAGVFAAFVTQRESSRADRAAAASHRVLREAAAQVVRSVEETDVSLETEIQEASASLAQTIARLRQVSRRAEAFEAEVQELVARAEAAKATARMHEADAKKIGRLLGFETEERLRREIDNLASEYNAQLDAMRRSGNRVALWTFVGGVVLGTVGNVVVALLIH